MNTLFNFESPNSRKEWEEGKEDLPTEARNGLIAQPVRAHA